MPGPSGNLSIMNLIAQAGGDGLDPALAMRLRGLKSADAANAAQAVGQTGKTDLSLGPLFSGEPQGFSLAGNPAATGQALLAPPPAPAAPDPMATPPRQRKRLNEMPSYQRYQELEGKWKKTPWFMPAQIKDRLEGQMDRTLRVAALEMADEGDVQRDSQFYADFLRDNLNTKSRNDFAASELELARQKRADDMKRLEQQAKNDAGRLALGQGQLDLGRAELGERTAARKENAELERARLGLSAAGKQGRGGISQSDVLDYAQKMGFDLSNPQDQERFAQVGSFLLGGGPTGGNAGAACSMPGGQTSKIFKRGPNGQLQRVK